MVLWFIKALVLWGSLTDKGWILVLKVKGPKQVIGMDDVIDLRKPGIEKLHLFLQKSNMAGCQ
ncbi:hypothetical protein [Salmonella enterica]|uniref:hypothetical protein n=1 Tax=Salmonella enterica TaxID=28901 RepID=UPI0019648F5F|nr:hypothetical protein [Salmonella enterica]